MILPIETKDIAMKGMSGAIVYAYYKQYPEKGVTKTAMELGLSRKTVQTCLAELECAGYIKLIRNSEKERSTIVRVETLR